MHVLFHYACLFVLSDLFTGGGGRAIMKRPKMVYHYIQYLEQLDPSSKDTLVFGLNLQQTKA